MQAETLKITFAAFYLVVTSPAVVSILSSIVFIIYIASMLKINVVDKKYNKSWGNFFKSWLLYFKKKQK